MSGFARRWAVPLVVLLVTAFAAFQLTLAMMPGFVMARAWDRLTERSEPNTMTHVPLITAEMRAIVRPSPDLAYSVCPLDLSEGPVQIHVEPIPGRYWSLTVFDDQTNAAFVASDREVGEDMLDLTVGGTDAASVDLPGNKGVALLRILLNGREDFAEVDRLRRASSCELVAAD